MPELTPEQLDAVAQRDADYASLAAFQEKISTIAIGAIDRTRAAATTVQTAATAIAGLYTGVLGLLFAADANPIPLRAVIAPLFLGAAIVLSTAYTSYLKNVTRDQEFALTQGLEPVVFARMQFIIDYVRGITAPRSSLMRAAVVSLALGLATMPLAFISKPAFLPPIEPFGTLMVLQIGAAAIAVAALADRTPAET